MDFSNVAHIQWTNGSFDDKIDADQIFFIVIFKLPIVSARTS